MEELKVGNTLAEEPKKFHHHLKVINCLLFHITAKYQTLVQQQSCSCDEVYPLPWDYGPESP